MKLMRYAVITSGSFLSSFIGAHPCARSLSTPSHEYDHACFVNFRFSRGATRERPPQWGCERRNWGSGLRLGAIIKQPGRSSPPRGRPSGSGKASFRFCACIGTMNRDEAAAGALASWTAAVLCRFCARGPDPKAPEDWRTPKPGGTAAGSWRVRTFVCAAALATVFTGCSIRRMAVNKLGDALAAGGTTFASDDDPDLVKAAAPFSLKLMESLLAESPKHKGLLLATASGFTQYAYAFVQQDADEMEEKDVAAAAELRARARKLYLRARNYGFRGLELKHAGFENELRDDAKTALGSAATGDVALLYWT